MGNFRPDQHRIVHGALKGRDCFVVMPTGGGKSLCYQLPAVLSLGVTIVISPLVSLMRDQVMHMLDLPCGGVPTACLCSSTKEQSIREIMRELNRSPPQIKLLLMTPEKLALSGSMNDILQRLHARGQLARFVVDEAHCMVQWGFDFRKEYKDLSKLRRLFKGVPLMALTATATPDLQQETIRLLKMTHPLVVRQSFNRPNLRLEISLSIGQVRRTP